MTAAYAEWDLGAGRSVAMGPRIVHDVVVVDATPESDAAMLMTIGELARRTGASVKVLRRYDGAGLLYSAGRSRANYRLFDESALWCVAAITGLRNLGLTVGEIRELAGVYLDRPDEPIGPHLAGRLSAVRDRLDTRMAELNELRQRIRDFETANRDRLAGTADDDFRDHDPRATATPLDRGPGRSRGRDAGPG